MVRMNLPHDSEAEQEVDMTMHIWLKNKAGIEGYQKGLDKLREEGAPGMPVQTGPSGKKYLVVREDLFDPTASQFSIQQEYVERVTLKDGIYRGLRLEGIYRHEGATLMVRTRSTTGRSGLREESQSITASAPSIEALKAIYSLVRRGELLPDEDWEAEQLSPPAPSQPEDDATEPSAD